VDYDRVPGMEGTVSEHVGSDTLSQDLTGGHLAEVARSAGLDLLANKEAQVRSADFVEGRC
jgi:hypothetical protein